jgi:imidazolonepropionase-like amidohydrolase
MATVHGIVAGWLADGSGRPLARRQLVAIHAGRIRCIRQATEADLAAPGIIDWSGGLVIPGLVDSHVHLFMSGTPDPATRQWQLAASFEGLKPVMDRHVRQHLAAGVVAVRDGGDYGGYALHYRDTVLRKGTQPFVLRTAGRAWRMPGRYGRLIGRAAPQGQTAADAIRYHCEAIDHVKLVNSGLNSLKIYGRTTPPQFAPGHLARAVGAAAARRWPVMVHANGQRPVGDAVAAGARSIEHGFFMGADNLARLAAQRVTWVPTAVTMQGYHRHSEIGSIAYEISRRNLDHQLEQIRQARALGVDVAAGTDAGSLGVHHGRALKAEIVLIMQAGYSLAEAVRCATANGARLLGLPDLGELTAGRRATFVALAGGPEDFPDNLEKPAAVFVAGQAVLGPAAVSGFKRR